MGRRPWEEEEGLLDIERYGSRRVLVRKSVILFAAVVVVAVVATVVVLTVVYSIPSHASDEVHTLPVFGPLKTKTRSGFLSANKTYGAHLFYLFMESQGDPANDPVILWLQGGPGSTSMFGCFCELGPYIMLSSNTFTHNNYSWNERANILWVDQPVGTGYSYVEDDRGYNKDEASLSLYLYTALVHFMEIHSEYSHQPFYIFGESYAGKYVPWLAHTILQDKNTKINLVGVGIGNGWVDPRWQSGTYAPFLRAHGRVTDAQVAEIEVMFREFLELLEAEEWLKAQKLDYEMLDKSMNDSVPVVTNYYDIRYAEDPTEVCYNAMLDYFSREDVKIALYAEGKKFQDGELAYEYLSEDEEQSALFLFPEILVDTDVLLYNGEYDLICNWMGTAQFAANIPDWPGQVEFNNTQNVSWFVDGTLAGNYKSAENLVQLMVYDAGHMSPFDQPKHTQTMVYEFIDGGFFKP